VLVARCFLFRRFGVQDEMIETVLGRIESRLLEKRVTHFENGRERTRRTEYWFMGRCVRSDVDITLLKGITASAIAGRMA
jgi:hypothetical protein